jgi:ectoine hydroxylase-related dioxygenase (phytanoyl-CoA dioxygenase family)
MGVGGGVLYCAGRSYASGWSPPCRAAAQQGPFVAGGHLSLVDRARGWRHGRLVRSLGRGVKRKAEDLPAILEALRFQGYAVVEDLLPGEMLEELRKRLPPAFEAFKQAVPAERLAASGERGIVRLPMLFDSYFLKLLELPQLLAILDATVGSTAIMHLQNAFLTPPRPVGEGEVFQETFHRDFPRVIGGVLLSLNVFIALDDFSRYNGCTQVAPGTHQREVHPSVELLDCLAVDVEGPAGTALVFDSTLWHRGGQNQSERLRMAINMQFTKSYFRQQMDYPRALPTTLTDSLPERTRQLLGFYVRVPASLAEYYVPPSERLYRPGQG